VSPASPARRGDGAPASGSDGTPASPARAASPASPARRGDGAPASGGTRAPAGGRADASYLLDSRGPAAPPRDNGELVFSAPWESQAFGIALALQDAGSIDWEEFRQSLISEIGGWEAAHPSGEGWSYYECWLRSLERLASSKGLINAGDLHGRLDALAARPDGHDHRAGT
jgi:nitrile hydratase accessory protein